jgi:hypothetical protein
VAHSLGTTAVSWMLRDPEGCKRVHSTVLLDPVIFLLCDPTVATTFVYKDPQSCMDLLMHYFLSRELFIANALSRHFQWSQNILFVDQLSHVHEDADANGMRNSKKSLTSSSRVSSSARLSQRSDASDDFFVADMEAEAEREGYGLRSRARGGAAKLSSRSSDGLADCDGNINNFNDLTSSGKFRDELRHSIFLSSHDVIVPVGAVSRYLESKRSAGLNYFEVTLFHGTHGEMFVYPRWVSLIINKIKERCELI